MLKGRWDTHNYDRLRALLEGPPGRAVFDFDNTLIYNDLGEACMYFLARRGLLPTENPAFREALIDNRFHSEAEAAAIIEYGNRYHSESDAADRDAFAAEILHLYEKIHEGATLDTTYRWTRIFFMDRTPAELSQLAREVLAYELEREVGHERLSRAGGQGDVAIPTGIRIVPEVAELIRELEARDWTVRVVTASPRLVIAAVIERWGLRPDQVTGMELAVGSDGKLLPEIVEPMPCQAGKITALQTEPGWQGQLPNLMAGDSVGDRELLSAADTAILFDRGDTGLRAEAEQKGNIVQKQFVPHD